jgi:hypothetical protein
VKGKPSYDEDMELQNENGIVKIELNTLPWKQLMSNLKSMGFSKVEVVKCTDVSGKEMDVTDELKAEVSAALAAPKKKLTEDQKKIKALEDKIEAMTKKPEPKEKPKAKK